MRKDVFVLSNHLIYHRCVSIDARNSTLLNIKKRRRINLTKELKELSKYDDNPKKHLKKEGTNIEYEEDISDIHRSAKKFKESTEGILEEYHKKDKCENSKPNKIESGYPKQLLPKFSTLLSKSGNLNVQSSAEGKSKKASCMMPEIPIQSLLPQSTLGTDSPNSFTFLRCPYDRFQLSAIPWTASFIKLWNIMPQIQLKELHKQL